MEEANGFEVRVAEVLHQKHRWRWRALTIWIILFTLTVIVMYRSNHHLVGENRSRIADIQKSRIDSCQANYEGIRKVAISLYPPAKIRSVAQAESLSKLNQTIKGLKSRCAKQTKLK